MKRERVHAERLGGEQQHPVGREEEESKESNGMPQKFREEEGLRQCRHQFSRGGDYCKLKGRGGGGGDHRELGKGTKKPLEAF